jgi:DNA-binding transcriptional ArsR family regulator
MLVNTVAGDSAEQRHHAPGDVARDPNLTRILANPWRAEILAQLYVREMSPSQFVDQVGGEISTISRHFRRLAELGYIEIVDEKSGGRRRGGVEHIYRTTQRNQLDSNAWSTLALSAREKWSRNAIAFYLRRITEAMDAGTFDAEVDRHFAWDGVSLDRQAWKQITDRLDEVLAWLPELEAEASQRMKESGEDPIPATIGLAAFRSPTVSDLKDLRSQHSESD